MFQQSAIPARAWSELESLNRAFLALLCRAPARGRLHALGPEVLERLPRDDAGARERLAGMPFALFSFRLHETTAWHTRLDRQVREPVTGLAALAERGPAGEFALLGLGVLREMTLWEPNAARLFFGVTPDLCQRFARLEAPALPELVPQAADGLEARFARKRGFWHDMLMAAANSDDGRFRCIRDLGLQLSLQRALRVRGRRLPDGVLCRQIRPQPPR